MFLWQHVRNLLESSDQVSKADSLRALQRSLEEDTSGRRNVAAAIRTVLEEAEAQT